MQVDIFYCHAVKKRDLVDLLPPPMTLRPNSERSACVSLRLMKRFSRATEQRSALRQAHGFRLYLC